MQFPHIYPDPESRNLRAALAAECGLDAKYIMAGAGADELIDLLMRVTLDMGDVIINTPPTFGMYKFDAEVNGAKVVNVNRDKNFAIDVEGIEAAVRQHNAKIVFVTSPNNPDGSVLPTEQIERCATPFN
jgi:histidinol-phosphate aminotransferase